MQEATEKIPGTKVNKRGPVNRLTLKEKLEILKKLENRVPVKVLKEEYKVGMSTIYDVKYAAEKLRRQEQKSLLEASLEPTLSRTRLGSVRFAKVDAAVYDWYKQQRASGIALRGIDVREAAQRFAILLNVPDFRGSFGWLYKFYKRHGINTKRVAGEIAPADVATVQQLQQLMRDNDIQKYEIYNADETCLHWKSMPNNTMASRHESSTPGLKASKQHVSVLLCANAAGTHKVKPLVVGNAQSPRMLHNSMDQLPVSWCSNKKSSLTRELFVSWFLNDFVPAVRHFQMTVHRIPRHEVKALLILDPQPVHRSQDELQSADGRIRVKFLPPNTALLIQPMDQGVFLACKQHYKRLFLNDVLAVEPVPEGEEDTLLARTLQNIKDYNIRDALYNLKAAWDKITETTVRNAWKKLLNGGGGGVGSGAAEAVSQQEDAAFEGFEVEEAQSLFRYSGDTAVTEDDVAEWLMDVVDHGCLLTQEEIVAGVLRSYGEGQEEEEEVEEVSSIINLREVRAHLDALLNFTAATDLLRLIPFYQILRDVRAVVIDELQRRTKKKQSKIGDYFPKVTKCTTDVSNVNCQPSTSGDSVFGLSPQPSTSKMSDLPPLPSPPPHSPSPSPHGSVTTWSACITSSSLQHLLEHFDQDQLEHGRADGKKRLRWNAVPTIFAPHSVGGTTTSSNKITGTCFKPIKEAEIYAVLQGSDPEYSDEDSIFEKTNDSDDEDDDFKRSDDEGEFMHSDKDEKYEEYLSNLESEIDSEASDDSATSSSTSPHKKRRLATDMEDLQFTYTEPLLQGDIGLRWSNKPVMETVPKPNRDIVNGIRSGPDGLATIADTPEQCLELFLDLDMINEIVIHTNSAISAISEKVSTKNATVEETSVDEIKALIGILIFSGCRRDNHLSTAEMWNTQVGSPLYQAAMSERRFSFLLECLCFDEAATRRERSKTDKLAPIRQLWNEFLTKCQKSYVPGETLTVGEQLLPFHGQCGFCVNFANKPAKYGIKLSVICDAKSKYMLNAIPYLRKDDYTPACQGLELRHITKELCKPYFNTWRNVTTESCFTSIPLSMDLLNNCGLTSVGDLRLNRPHIPPNMTRKDGRKENSSVFCFAEGLTMVSYMPYPQKLVVHLSTMHTQPTIDKNKRPEIINYYNRKKSAVDKFDQMTKQYSCSRKTNRWHLCMFYFIINAATINAWVISNNNKKTQQEVEQARGQFMQDLALRLVTPWAQKRIDSGNLGRRLQWTKKDMVKINVPKQSVPPSLPIAKRCGSCTGEEERKSQSVCIACYEPVCDLHSYITCLNCQ
ncbi:uncharacterized protein LOC121863017 [Homarus americanus]|uniref:uncharacterized protein LOC121863017 n=1 Tax=Homarus americanus TaxID=6706 RepID=UPI001C4574EC|nr:uncharacterized protein LOC121863017 [Homarus americanus]